MYEIVTNNLRHMSANDSRPHDGAEIAEKTDYQRPLQCREIRTSRW